MCRSCFGKIFGRKKLSSLPLGIHHNEISVLKSVEALVPIIGFKNYQSTEADYFLKKAKKLKWEKESA